MLARKLRQGELSSAALLELFLERVERLDRRLNAVVVRDFERARARAAAADEATRRGEVWGPLHGLPMTVKEEMAIAGLPRCCGRAEDIGHVDQESCEAVARLQAAGAVIFGKTNVPTGCLDWQSYNAVYGQTLNPWRADVSPGGSSGGAAAAVAAGLTPLELGGDTAGSIRVPAAFCGVVGLAPSHGTVPTGRPDWKAVVYGPLARSAADCALALSVLAGRPAAADAAARDVARPVEWGGVRVAAWSGGRGSGLARGDASFCQPDAAVQRAVRRAAEALRAAGATVVEEARPRALADPNASLALYRRLLSLTAETADEGAAGGEGAAVRAEQAALASAWASFFARTATSTSSHDVGAIDVMLLPVTVSNAFASDPAPGQDAHTAGRAFASCDGGGGGGGGAPRDYGAHFFWPHLAIVAQLPSVAVPVGTERRSGLPLSVQLVGPRGAGGEERLLRFAAALMALLPPMGRPPGC